MKFLSLLLVLVCAGTSFAQCPGGVCPPRVRYYQPQQVVYRQPVQVVYQQPAQAVYQAPTQNQGGCPCMNQGGCPCANPAPVPAAPAPTPVVTAHKGPLFVTTGGPLFSGYQSSSYSVSTPPPPPPVVASTGSAPVVSYGSTGAVSYGSTGMAPVVSYGSGDGSFSATNYSSISYGSGRYTRQTAGPNWTYSGSDLAGHLQREHGVNAAGMSHSEMVAAHSDAHNRERGSRSSSCRARPRIFGRWR